MEPIMSIKELREKQAKLVAEAREKLEEIKDDTPEARVKELEESYDRAMAEYDRLEARAKREEELAAREAALDEPDPRRPTGEDRSVKPGAEDKDAEERINAVFRNYLRFGTEGLNAEERKLLRGRLTTEFSTEAEKRAQSTSTTAGGYLVPQGFSGELVVSMKAWGPMLDPGITRELVTATGNQIPWPTLNDTANQAYRIGENTQETHSDGDLTFGQKFLDAYKYASGVILVSEEIIQDAAINIEQVIRDAMAIRLGRKVNSDLTIGDGSGDPNGIVTASTKGFDATLADGISFDDMIELEHSVDPAYRTGPNVRWMFNDTTLKKLRKIKDTVTGNYIWQPADVRTGAPSTILDHPYSINQAMANVADSQKSVLFGDFSKYIVRRVREFAVRRLVERYADYDQVGFIGFARYDGELMDTAAVKHLLHPATN
jgi:HK97 family phage major capsid protein